MGIAAARSATLRAEAKTPAPEGQVATLIVVGLTLLALALRASQIHQSLEGDEVFTYQDIFGRGFGTVLSTVHTGGENSPPLFFLLAWITAKLGNPTVWIRVPSIVSAAATVPVVYLLGRRTLGRTAGVAAAAIFAVSPFAVWYGVEARPYATMTFFVAASTLFVIKAVRERRIAWWAAYVVCLVAAAYCHYTAIFLLIVQALWALWMSRDSPRVPIAAHVVAAILYLPWLPYLRGKELAVIGGLHPLTAHNVLTDLVRVLPGFPSSSPQQIPGVFGLIIFAACTIAGAVAFLHSRRPKVGGALVSLRPGHQAVAGHPEQGAVARPAPLATTNPPPGTQLGQPGGIGLLLMLALATPVGLLLYSMLATDLWLSRGLSASLPAATLVLAALLISLPRPGMIVAVAATLGVLVFGTIKSFTTPYVRENYRGIAAYLDRYAGPRDPVIIFSLLAGPAVPAMAQRHHEYVYRSKTEIDHLPVARRVFFVYDLSLFKILHLSLPHPTGLRLIGKRSYPGPFPAGILIFAPG